MTNKSKWDEDKYNDPTRFMRMYLGPYVAMFDFSGWQGTPGTLLIFEKKDVGAMTDEALLSFASDALAGRMGDDTPVVKRGDRYVALVYPKIEPYAKS